MDKISLLKKYIDTDINVTAEVVDGIFKDKIFKYVSDTRRPNEY